MNRRMRLAAVTLTTLMLMMTTGLGIAAVQEAVSTTTAVSLEAATATPQAVSTPQTFTPTASVTATLPDLSKRPALPSLDRILKAIPTSAPSVAQATAPAPAAAVVTAAPGSTPRHGDDSHESEGHDD